MRRQSLVPALLGAACLLACASVRVSVDYDPTHDFSGYRTFTWFPAPRQKTGDYRIDNPLLDARIRNAVVRHLTERGFQQVEDRTPDFYVVYHLGIEQKLDVRTVNRGYVNYWGYYTSWPETTVQQYDEGTLVVDIADAREKKLVWRGVGVGRVRSSSRPERSIREVNEAVDRILSRFPPPPG